MSIALDTAVSPTDARPAYESVRLHTSTPPPSRQTRDARYSSRAVSRIFPPRQVTVSPSQGQLTSPPPGTEDGIDTTQNHTNQSDHHRLQGHIDPQVRSADIGEVYDGQDHDRMDAEMESDETPLARDSADGAAPIASVPVEVSVMDTTMDTAPDPIPPTAAGPLPPPPPPPPLRAIDGWSSSPATTGPTTAEGNPDDDGQDDDIDDQDSEDSVSTDEPHNFHTNSNTFKEDETSPDEEELKEILDLGEETNAEDHERWQAYTFDPLEDPEYVPAETGRISWILKGVNGTVEKPVIPGVLRSPSVLIGGLYWNIKYFPRGNDGTEQMSVYIECSRTPYEKRDSVEKPRSTVSGFTAPVANMVVSPVPSTRRGSNGEANSSQSIPQCGSQPEAVKSSPTSPATNDMEVGVPFDVAAQISCIVYNPDEPRVHFEQKSCHRFCDENPDWGWTRFHGPWFDIHRRQRLQRQALLRHDTLAFTAYIRIIKDDTGSLWWHPPKDNPVWDSVARCGQRGLSHGSVNRSAIVSAFSTWLHIGPVADALRAIRVPQPFVVPHSRPLPFIEALQLVLQDMGISSLPSHVSIPLEDVTETARRYGIDLNSRMDVVEVWDKLRQLVKLESQQSQDFSAIESLLDGVWTFRQPNQALQATPELAKDVSENSANHAHRGKIEPNSVQETIDELLKHDNDKGDIDYPWCLHIELHRQSFDKKKRKWKKLTHKIKLNETVSFLDKEYTLFGMIVHQGDLESGEYFSVIRPQGPGTKWFRYYNDSGRKDVVCLTQKQACQAHEGSGVQAQGNTAVAYVAVYLKQDFSEAMKSYQLDRPHLLADDVKKRKWNVMLHGDDVMDVHIWREDWFLKHRGRGMLDPWATSSKGTAALDGSDRFVIKIRLPVSTNLRSVKETLEKEHLTDTKGKFWALNMSNWTTVNFLPRFEQVRDDMDLCELARHTRGFHLWYASLPPEKSRTSSAMDRSDGLPEQQLRQEASAASLTLEHNAGPSTDEDVIMEGTQDDITRVPNPPVTPPQPLAEAMDFPFHVAERATYCFLKIFDPNSQELSAVGTLFGKRLDALKDLARRQLSMDADQAIDLYQESGLTVSQAALLDDNMNWYSDGAIFLAQKHLSETEIADFENAGKPATIPSYFESLEYLSDSSRRQPHLSTHYFGKPHFHLTLSHGFPHGPCTIIHLSGDAFHGNYTLGTRCGQGTMAYSSGDTYTGTWLDDLPHGQGTMTYGKSGNVYTGGWKKGKRHGKGRMEYEVADEEENLCKICYEKEMDALLYDCGHVVACEECARCVEVCPFCRRSVRGVVKIWRT